MMMAAVVGVGPLRIQTQTLVLVPFQLLRKCSFSYKLLVVVGVASSSLLLCFLQPLLLLLCTVMVVGVSSFCSCRSSET